MATDTLRYLANEIGFRPAGRCFLDVRFLLALIAGVFVVWIGHNWLPPFSSRYAFDWLLILSLVVWQPLFEEILFRGLIQGQLIKRAWGQRTWLHISAANVITSLLFVVAHMVMNPPLFALTVFVPSLLYGYFREHCNSVYPSIELHGAYNAFVIVGLLIAGNMGWPA
jgi:membrane protease YdiL (CAAX protease family)